MGLLIVYQNSILIRKYKKNTTKIASIYVPKISQLEKLWLEFVWLGLGNSRLSYQKYFFSIQDVSRFPICLT